MSDFASLLGKFQHSTESLSKRSGVDEEDKHNRKKKRAREIDAKDFSPVEKIFLLCPAGVQTGGPEALHQLCDKLNRTTSIPAYMVYVVSEGNGVTFASRAKTPASYRNYQSPIVNYDPLQQGDPTHLMIWPECWTDEMLDYLNRQFSSMCYLVAYVNNNTNRFKDWDRKDIFHMAQSKYATKHLLENGATHILRMTEYISDPPEPDDSTEREIDVLFNPLKGVHYTDEIRKRSGASINFRPIGGGLDGRIRLAPQEVRSLLMQGKIYIDFGPHPGMDRLPREAALAGCVVVTNMEGAAMYNEDIPLPPKYKIRTFDPETVHKLLKQILNDYKSSSSDMEEYREWIRGQQTQMTKCVSNLVEEFATKRSKNAE
eukprot:CAMPEP_0178933114 /NCGR_PEP_ID=MMETSP0786-20121207/23067_1 /TAXON_ID=186022 /ORGANISM="Thalassionema frauenfeldii, Strain CCMP 1798" /LENGTH=372 /DNA_ID=CAMNT_0020610629 /DNA_START=69 /DNA_END=1191 /DNA_ORIENTATION=+